MPLIHPIAQRRIEGAAILVAAMVAYGALGFSWATFALCFFLPDLSIAVYLTGPRAGALAYNAVHFFLWPILLGAWGIAGDVAGAQQAALIWGAHVAFDRAPVRPTSYRGRASGATRSGATGDSAFDGAPIPPPITCCSARVATSIRWFGRVRRSGRS